MKKLFLFISSCGAAAFLILGNSFGASPATSCPSGYVTINEQNMIIADTSCTSGYTSAGYTSTCLVTSPDGVCFMYAPANTDYSNDIGAYQFTDICPLT